MAKKKIFQSEFTCGQCQYVVAKTEQWTLSLKGKPMVGRCPLVTNRSVLLSEMACASFKMKSYDVK